MATCVFCFKPASSIAPSSSSGGGKKYFTRTPSRNSRFRKSSTRDPEALQQKIPESVDEELDSFFIVRRLLRLEDEVCWRLLGEWGRPASWGINSLCPSCELLFQEARQVHKQISLLDRELLQLKAQVETKIVLSDAEEGGGGNRKGRNKRSRGHHHMNAVQFIREAVIERCKVPGGPLPFVDQSIVKIQQDEDLDDDGASDAGSFVYFANILSDEDENEEETRQSSDQDWSPERHGGLKNLDSSGDRSTRSGRKPSRITNLKNQKIAGNQQYKKLDKIGVSKRPKIEESPNVSAKRMADFLKSSLILKQSIPSPSQVKSRSSLPITSKGKAGTRSGAVSATNKISSPVVPDKKSDSETKLYDGQNILGQQVDKLCEELEREITQLSEQVVEQSTGSKEGTDDSPMQESSLGVEIDLDTPAPVSKIENDGCSDVDVPVDDDDDYVPSNSEDVDDRAPSCSDEDNDNVQAKKPAATKTPSSVTKNNTPAPPKKLKKPKKVHLLYRCSECRENVVNQYALELHLRHQHSKFHCPECKNNFDTWDELYTHTNNDHPATFKPFLCDLCPKRFGTHQSLVIHARTYHDAQPKSTPKPHSRHPRVNIRATCKQCGRGFTNASSLAGHVRLVHPTEEQRTCKYCLEKFETMASLMTHLRLNHKMEKAHMCDQCPQTFAYELTLVTHQYREHGVPFPERFVNPQRQCEDCGKVFSRAKALDLHKLLVHGNPERNLCCPREGCAFKARTEHEIKRHVMHVHDKVPRPKRPPVPCPECNKLLSGNFARDTHLKKVHGRTDIIVKEWNLPCNMCEKKFTNKRWLFSHQNRLHGANHDMSVYTSQKPRPRKPREPKKRKRRERSESEYSSEEVIEEHPGQYLA